MQKKKLYIALALVIVLIAVALIVTSLGNPPEITNQIGQPVPQSVLNKLMIPESLSNQVGTGGVLYFPTKISSTSQLTNNSKPEILYIGAEYCPYCAVTRWGLIMALMRFGTFSNLHYMASNESDVFPNTPTFDFYNSTYTSDYVTFVSVETTTRNRETTLQTPSPAQTNIFNVYDLDNSQIPTDERGGIPFIDFANQSLQLSAPVLPSVLQGQNWTTVINNLNNTNSTISQSLIGSADVFTAQICLLTNNTPQSVCAQSYVARVQKYNLNS